MRSPGGTGNLQDSVHAVSARYGWHYCGGYAAAQCQVERATKRSFVCVALSTHMYAAG